MLEKYLLQIGMRCGTVKNFNTVILEGMRTNEKQRWYFLTPIKVTEKSGQLKEVTFNCAFPFLANKDDISEQKVLERLNPLVKDYQDELLKVLREILIVPSFTFSVIPFWANEKAAERNERKDFGQTRIHIISAQLIVKYREHWFDCNC